MDGIDSANATTVSILGIAVSRLTVTALLNIIEDIVGADRRAVLLNVNVYGMNLAFDQHWFRSLYTQADYVLCDGFGVKWAASLLGQRLPERFTPPDWLPAVAELASRRGYSVFFLGNQPGVATQAAARLTERFPSLTVAGTYHGYFDKSLGSPENEEVVRLVNATKPNILYVGFGMPMQERWLMENWGRLQVNVAVTVGAMLDFVAGVTPRGPRWMTDHGLEWFTRLITEPRRLWRRYLIGNPLFVMRVLAQRLGLLRFD